MKTTITFLVIALFFIGQPSLINAQQVETDAPEEKKEIYIPKDLEDCFNELNRLLKEEDIENIRSGIITPNDMHFGVGMGLRNSWGLWGGSRLAIYFNDLGIHHPDDMSSIILDSYVLYLKGEPIELNEQIEYYKAYWEEAREAMESMNVERQRSPNSSPATNSEFGDL